MVTRRNRLAATTVALLLAGLWLGQSYLEGRARVTADEAPRFEVDPFWPKPLPNSWRLGSVIGVWADGSDKITSFSQGVPWPQQP